MVEYSIQGIFTTNLNVFYKKNHCYLWKEQFSKSFLIRIVNATIFSFLFFKANDAIVFFGRGGAVWIMRQLDFYKVPGRFSLLESKVYIMFVEL